MYGLGNWADTAEHVGGRTKEECYQHYLDTYIHSPNYPLPVTGKDFGDQEEFVERKKRRLEELQSRPLALPPPKPLASAPTCHDIGGYMPGRLEFETEYENEAETLVKDMEFGKVYQFGGDSQPPGDPPPGAVEDVKPEGEGPVDPGEESEGELELKLTVLEMFNERYDRRVAAKELIFDRGLMNYRQINAAEKKKSKEEKDLTQRAKVFARIQTAEDHEKFVDGLLYETTLRRRIAELQEYRRNGITTLAEGERYDHAKTQRITQRSNRFSELIPAYDRVASRGARIPGALSDRKTPSTPRPTSTTLTLASSSSLHLLTPLEQALCSTLRLLPRPYLFLKEVLLREWVRTGGRMGAQDARLAVASLRDSTGGATGEWGEKVERVWEFLVQTGGLRRAEQREEERKERAMQVEGERGMSVDGVGTPVPVEGAKDNGAEAIIGDDDEEAMEVEPQGDGGHEVPPPLPLPPPPEVLPAAPLVA